jgi:uncharacterized membrane protein YGL010W
MKSFVDQIAQYASYHQNSRNVATHFFGIPLIVLGVATLLARPTVELGGVPCSPAGVLAVVTCLYYLRLSLGFGVVMSMIMAAMVWCGHLIAGASMAVGWAAGLGLFVVGWAFQFLGHHYEGRKPAFVDDLMGLAIGPLFLVVEVAFALGMSRDTQAQVKQRLQSANLGHARLSPGTQLHLR